MSAHPADQAKPGDAFRDENGVIWMLTADGDLRPWVTFERDGNSWHSLAIARAANLTRLVPETHDVRLATAHREDCMRYENLLEGYCEQLGVSHYNDISAAIARNRAALDAAAVGFPAPDASNPTDLRRAAAICDHLRASRELDDAYQAPLAKVAREICRYADRLEADAADHIKAVEFAEDLSFYGALNSNGRSQLVTALVEFRRAGRDAERGA